MSLSKKIHNIHLSYDNIRLVVTCVITTRFFFLRTTAFSDATFSSKKVMNYRRFSIRRYNNTFTDALLGASENLICRRVSTDVFGRQEFSIRETFIDAFCDFFQRFCAPKNLKIL